eukprot:43686-Amphidinium_carterae.1
MHFWYFGLAPFSAEPLLKPVRVAEDTSTLFVPLRSLVLLLELEVRVEDVLGFTDFGAGPLLTPMLFATVGETQNASSGAALVNATMQQAIETQRGRLRAFALSARAVHCVDIPGIVEPSGLEVAAHTCQPSKSHAYVSVHSDSRRVVLLRLRI